MGAWCTVDACHARLAASQAARARTSSSPGRPERACGPSSGRSSGPGRRCRASTGGSRARTCRCSVREDPHAAVPRPALHEIDVDVAPELVERDAGGRGRIAEDRLPVEGRAALDHLAASICSTRRGSGASSARRCQREKRSSRGPSFSRFHCWSAQYPPFGPWRSGRASGASPSSVACVTSLPLAVVIRRSSCRSASRSRVRRGPPERPRDRGDALRVHAQRRVAGVLPDLDRGVRPGRRRRGAISATRKVRLRRAMSFTVPDSSAIHTAQTEVLQDPHNCERRESAVRTRHLAVIQGLVEHLLVDALLPRDLAERAARSRRFLDDLRGEVVADVRVERGRGGEGQLGVALGLLGVRLDPVDAALGEEPGGARRAGGSSRGGSARSAG